MQTKNAEYYEDWVPCNDIYEDHEVVGVEVGDTVLVGEHVQNQLLDRIQAFPAD